MTENAPATERGESGRESIASRLRGLLRRFDPTMLGLLGFLSLPAYVSDSLSFLNVFGVFFLFFFWVFVGPVVDVLLARNAGEETEPTDWIEMGGIRYLLVAYLTLPLAFLNPLVVTQDLLQFFGGAVAFVRHRGSLPDAESYDQQVSYRLPFDGEWTVVNGSPEREFSHSWIYPNQRYAYDFLITDEDGRSHPEGAGTDVEEYYCYDEPVLAPADGVAVDTFDAVLESSHAGGFSHPLKRSIPGGYVVIKHAGSEYSFLAHLRSGSVAVDPGDRIECGEEVGRCGHSGNSSEPHLHFQVQDGPDFAAAASLPIRFDDVALESPGVPHEPDLVPGYDVWHSGTGGESDAETDADGPETDDGTTGSPAATDSPDGYHDRTFVIEGQRVRHAGRQEADTSSGRPTDGATAVGGSDPAGSAGRSTAGSLTGTGRGVAFGLAVGAVLTFGASIFVSGLSVALVVAAAAGLSVAVRVGFSLSGGEYRSRLGLVGAPLGLALAAAAVAGAVVSGAVGTGTLTGLLLVAGFLSYTAVAEVDRRRLGSVTPTRLVS